MEWLKKPKAKKKPLQDEASTVPGIVDVPKDKVNKADHIAVYCLAAIDYAKEKNYQIKEIRIHQKYLNEVITMYLYDCTDGAYGTLFTYPCVKDINVDGIEVILEK